MFRTNRRVHSSPRRRHRSSCGNRSKGKRLEDENLPRENLHPSSSYGDCAAWLVESSLSARRKRLRVRLPSIVGGLARVVPVDEEAGTAGWPYVRRRIFVGDAPACEPSGDG